MIVGHICQPHASHHLSPFSLTNIAQLLGEEQLVWRFGAAGGEATGVPDADDGKLVEGPSWVAHVLAATS
jgi:hypothetical protein